MSLTDRMATLGDKVRAALASVKGDKMLLLIVILLYLFSIMTVLSSSSFLADSETGRVNMLIGQLAIIGISGVALWVIYKYCTLTGLMRLGIIGYFISLGMLIFLTLHIRIPHVMESQNLNNAWRTIYFFGRIQVHVFEVVKVFSILYMAWAVTRWKEERDLMEENLTPQSLLEDPRGFRWIRRLAWNFKADWMNTPFFKRTLIVYLPFIVTCALVSRGSNSSAVIIAFGMIITLMIGGFGIRKLIAFMMLGGIALGGYMMLSGKMDGESDAKKSRPSLENPVLRPFSQPMRGVWKSCANKWTKAKRRGPTITASLMRTGRRKPPNGPSGKGGSPRWVKGREEARRNTKSSGCSAILCSVSSAKNTASSGPSL